MPFSSTNQPAHRGRNGRKPRDEKFARPIAAAEKRIADRLPELIDRQFELANGVLVEDSGLDGQPVVYRKPPDRQAIEYLLNRIMGKPTERVEQEHTGKDGGPVEIREIVVHGPNVGTDETPPMEG